MERAIMSTQGRWARVQRAIEKGKTARSLGRSKSDCPYERSEWGLGSWWDMGYDQQVELERQGREPAYPGGPGCPVICPDHHKACMELTGVTHPHGDTEYKVWACSICGTWVAEDGCVCLEDIA